MTQRQNRKRLRWLTFLLGGGAVVLLLGLGALLYQIVGKQKHQEALVKEQPAGVPETLLTEVKDGIHQPTGFIADTGLELVIANCTNCHSAQLVTQNRATREGWIGMIRWMQSSQNLWDLGVNEEAIVNYLAKNYAPETEGRRRNLQDIEWYPL